MGRTILLRISLVVSFSVVGWLLTEFTALNLSGFPWFISDILDYFTELFGTHLGWVFIGLFGLAWFILFVRFILSWLWENAWAKANK